jgi:hypothetical protein
MSIKSAVSSILLVAFYTLTVLLVAFFTISANAQTVHTWTTGAHLNCGQGCAGGSTETWDSQNYTQGAFLPYQSSSFQQPNVWTHSGSLYGQGLILEDISMTYGTLIPLTTPLLDGSTTYQIFTLSVEGSGGVHWTGSFTQYFKKTYHSGANGTGGGRCHCQPFYTYDPTRGSGTITAAS